MRAGTALDAFAIENLVVNGGVSDTAEASRPNQRVVNMRFICNFSKAIDDFISQESKTARREINKRLGGSKDSVPLKIKIKKLSENSFETQIFIGGCIFDPLNLTTVTPTRLSPPCR